MQALENRLILCMLPLQQQLLCDVNNLVNLANKQLSLVFTLLCVLVFVCLSVHFMMFYIKMYHSLSRRITLAVCVFVLTMRVHEFGGQSFKGRDVFVWLSSLTIVLQSD